MRRARPENAERGGERAPTIRFGPAAAHESTPQPRVKTDSVERLQRDLREGEFLEDIGDAVAIMDTSFRILYQNSADRELSGDHVGRFCYEAYELGAEVCAGCPLALVFSDGRRHTSERTSPSLHGSRRLEINASPITDREGRIVAGLEIVRDVTDRRVAEERLTESEALYREVYETAPLAFVLWDLETRVTGWNDQAQRMFGWTREEIVGRNFSDFIIPDSARVQVSEVVNLLLTGTLPSRSVNENVTKGGQIIVCEWNNALVRDAEGRVKGVISLGLDITERTKLEQRLEAAAMSDALTGLLNRRGFYVLAEQQRKVAHRLRRGLSLLYLDVDDMKQINDTHSHRAGDLALQDTAEILRATFRESDVIARVGGDEFVVLVTEPSGPVSPRALAEHLRANVARHNAGSGRDFALSLSIGVAHAAARHRRAAARGRRRDVRGEARAAIRRAGTCRSATSGSSGPGRVSSVYEAGIMKLTTHRSWTRCCATGAVISPRSRGSGCRRRCGGRAC